MSSRPPAPGDLGLVQAFVNTLDIESGTDELADPAALLAWLAGHGLTGDAVTDGAGPAEHRRAVAVREALRTVLAGRDPGRDVAAIADAAVVLDEAAARSRLTLRFDGPAGSAALVPLAEGIDGALGRLLAAVSRATVDGTWARLKVCRSDACQWAYYDHSRNGSSAWCDMAVCGSRHKMRAYRARERRRGDRSA